MSDSLRESRETPTWFRGALQKVRASLFKSFKGSGAHWEEQYERGGNSGSGSYGRLASYKAEFLNRFVQENSLQTVIEFGCGDGNQLSLAQYPSYIGLDVARGAIARCAKRFDADASKSFYLYESKSFVDNHRLFSAELALSLDVIYHLVEDDVFHVYMTHLFRSARRFVIVYSSNEKIPDRAHHVRHRRFTDEFPAPRGWRLVQEEPNRYPSQYYNEPDTSPARFFIFQQESAGSK